MARRGAIAAAVAMIGLTLAGCIGGNEDGGSEGAPSVAPTATDAPPLSPVLSSMAPHELALVQAPDTGPGIDSGADNPESAVPPASLALDVPLPEGTPSPNNPAIQAATCRPPVYLAHDHDLVLDYLRWESARLQFDSAAIAVSDWCSVTIEHGTGVMGPSPVRPASTATDPRPADAIQGTGSMAKVWGAAVIQDLIARGLIAWDDQVFCSPTGAPSFGHSRCLIHLPRLATPGTPRGDQGNAAATENWWQQIEVGHLIQHRGGFSQGAARLDGYAPDPDLIDLFPKEDAIAARLGFLGVREPTLRDIFQYRMDFPLDYQPNQVESSFDIGPGRTYADRDFYANDGYLLLGFVAEEVSGMSFMDYVESRIIAGNGYPDGEVRQFWGIAPASKYGGRGLYPEEPSYGCRAARSPFPVDWVGWQSGQPFPTVCTSVIGSLGGAVSSLTMSPEAMALFFRDYWAQGFDPRSGMARTSYLEPPAWNGDWPNQAQTWGQAGWGHNGGVDGANTGGADISTTGRQCPSGFNVVLMSQSWTPFNPPPPPNASAPRYALGGVCAVSDQLLSSPPRYLLSWAPDGPTFPFIVQGDAAFTDVIAQQEALGRRPIDVEVFYSPEGKHYASVWVAAPPSLEWRIVRGTEAGTLGDTMVHLPGEGYALEAFSTSRANGFQYVTLWTRDAEVQPAAIEPYLELTLFPNEVDWSQSRTLIDVSINSYGDGSTFLDLAWIDEAPMPGATTVDDTFAAVRDATTPSAAARLQNLDGYWIDGTTTLPWLDPELPGAGAFVADRRTTGAGATKVTYANHLSVSLEMAITGAEGLFVSEVTAYSPWNAQGAPPRIVVVPL